MQKLYLDPVDEPRPGKFILVLNKDDRRFRWRGATVEEALHKYLDRGIGISPENILFRRVEHDSWFDSLRVWEVDSPRAKAPDPGDRNARLLGCLYPISTFARTVRINPALATEYGVVEVYMQSDEIADHYSYLDRTGKIRPVNLIVDGDAIEEEASEDILRDAIEDAIPQALEPVFQYAAKR